MENYSEGIDKIYYDTVQQLSRDPVTQITFSLELLGEKKASHRIKLVYELLEKYKMFPECRKVEKNGKTSIKFRNKGNNEFNKKKNDIALKMYNNAIVNAPLDSEELYLAYSNRSAVNFSKKNYEECLIDIERVLTNYKCDENLRKKLNNRKAMCEKELSENPSTDEIDKKCKDQFKLSKSQHETIPVASISIELKYSKEMGRSVVAAQDILPGEVLAVEEPYCCIVVEDFYSQYCYGCLKRSDNMIPCENCCYVMFCDEDCSKEAFENFHKIDCKLMHFLSAMKFTKLELMALRVVIKAKCTHNDCESLKKVVSEVESASDPLLKGFVYDASNDKYILDSHSYKPIHAFETNVDKRGPSDVFQKGVTAAVCLHFLLKQTDFFIDCKIEDNNVFNNDCFKFYGGLLLHHNMTSPTSMHTISTTISAPRIGYTESAKFGSGAFAFASLLNHSCAPNIVNFDIGSNAALVALRPIKKGQQLFDNYGWHYFTHNVLERSKEILAQYKFRCQCEACHNNWPMLASLGRARISDKKSRRILSCNLLTEKLLRNLSNGDRSAALNIVKELYPYLIILEENAPSKELVEYQETMKQCWALFGNVEGKK